MFLTWPALSGLDAWWAGAKVKANVSSASTRVFKFFLPIFDEGFISSLFIFFIIFEGRGCLNH